MLREKRVPITGRCEYLLENIYDLQGEFRPGWYALAEHEGGRRAGGIGPFLKEKGAQWALSQWLAMEPKVVFVEEA